MNKKIYILLPDGVGIKNYIFSNIFKNTHFTVEILHNLDLKTLQRSQLELLQKYKLSKLKSYNESLIEKFLRELIHFTRLVYNSKIKSNESILSNYMPKKKSVKHKLFYWLVELIGNGYHQYKHIKKLELYYQKEIRKSYVYKYYFTVFDKEKPKKLFCTHQRAVIAAPIFAAAKDAGIKTVTAIYSWDNLPKARLALRSDYYIVWSPYMRKELKLYYPEIQNNQIKVLGTPQFQFHSKDKYIWSKKEFATFYNLDLSKKWICFSGDDKTTSPHDPEYLEHIAEEIFNSNLNDFWEILLRPVPTEGFEKYQHVLDRFPDLIKKCGAAWHLSSNWTNIFPLEKDLYILSSLCHHADVVVNVGSTMALDFSMHNKPSIFINYEADIRSNWSIKRVYNFEHFKTIKNLEPVIWLNNKSQLVDILENLEQIHNEVKSDMEKWCEKIIPKSLRLESQHLIKDFLLK